MAVIHAFRGIDMTASTFVGGHITAYTSSHIQVTSAGGSYIDNYYGHGFTYSADWITGGTVTGMNSSAFGQRIFEVSHVAADALTIADHLATGNTTQLFQYLLQGNDAFHSSADNDVIYSFAGNDVIIDYGGRDTFHGGAGIDTVVYNGPRSNYEIVVGAVSISVKDSAPVFPITDTLFEIERFLFSDMRLAIDINGNAGQAYRMYQAAFDRQPDVQGLGYWIKQIDDGLSLEQVAGSFLLSEEFRNIFGASPTPERYVEALYQNILQRAPDQEGFNYWVNEIRTGAATDAEMLALFAESPENQQLVRPDILNGIQYEEWIG